MAITSSQYYDENYDAYRLGWSPDHFHMGFWDSDTKTHEQSLLNNVLAVISELHLNSNDIVLDAGCGVGGASRYIVNNYKCRTIGLTYSNTLLEVAIEHSQNQINKGLLEYHFMDYNKTTFEDESFTKIFGIESICYAESKKNFFKEAFRLLKPNGRIVVSDGFLLRDNLTKDEKNRLNRVLKGWIVPNLSTVKDFEKDLEDIGFIDIKFINKSNEVNKSSLKMYNTTKFTRLIMFIMWKLRLYPESRYHSSMSGFLQRKLVENGILGYGIFSAQKPVK